MAKTLNYSETRQYRDKILNLKQFLKPKKYMMTTFWMK